MKPLPLHQIVLVLFLLLLFPCSASALEFRVLSWEGTITGLKFQNGRDTEVITAYDHALSPFYQKTDATPLRFYRETLVDGKPARTDIATPPLPEGLTRAILLLVRAPGPAESYTGSWLDDSPETSPPGTLRFLNYTRQPLALSAAGEQWMQPPGGSRRVAFDATRRAVPIQVGLQAGGQWRRVVNVSQPVRPGHRVLVILRDGHPSANLPPEPVQLLVFYEQS